MGKLKLEARQLIREQESVKQADIFYSQWLTEQLKDNKSTQVQKLKKNEYFQPGKMYMFHYHPVYLSKLKWYDRNPLILSLGQREFEENTVEFGVNLHLLPYNVRVFFLDAIYTANKVKINQQMIIKMNKAKKQLPLDIGPDDLGSITQKLHLDFAMRNYIRSGIKIPYGISYEHWTKMILIQDYNFKNITNKKLVAEYRKHVREHN